MVDLLQCKDRWNRLVVLPSENWFEKILRDHPELHDHEARVRRVIIDPDLVAFDQDDSRREVFYRWGTLPSPDDQA